MAMCTTGASAVTVLRHIFVVYGLPEQIVSDNGPQFTSEEFTKFLLANGVKYSWCSLYHPSFNGAVEHFVHAFKKPMMAGKWQTFSWTSTRELFTSYRKAPHATTGVPPCDLFLGQRILTRFDQLKPHLAKNANHKQAVQKAPHNLHAKAWVLVGQRVMACNLGESPKWLPGTISQQHGSVMFEVKPEDGRLWKCHTDQLKF